MKKSLFFILIIFSYSINAKAINIDIRDRINTKNFYRKVYPILFDKTEYRIVKHFKKMISKLPSKQKQEINTFITRLDRTLPINILMPLTYWRLIEPNKQNVQDILAFTMLYKLLLVRDYIDNPLTGPSTLPTAREYLKTLAGIDSITSDNIYKSLMLKEGDITISAKQASKIKDSKSFTTTVLSNRWIKENIRKSGLNFQNYVLSYLGFIKGNKIELISKNITKKERIKWVNARVIFNGGKLEWNKNYMKMPEHKNATGHPVFKNDPIFIKIRDLIASAKESIFIDISLFGGTMGGVLAKFIIDKTIKRRELYGDFRTVILHDYATNHYMQPEMQPVFDYIKNRIKNEKVVTNSVTLLQANIQRHPSGMPFNITDLIPRTPKTFALIEKRPTYYEAKADNSKVLVVDAKTDNPKAYFGSKNWTDHNGAYHYDNAICVEGPAAALIQASYYDDIEAALTENKTEQSWFYYKGDQHDNLNYLKDRKDILAWIKITRNSYKSLAKNSNKQGTIRIAESDVDGKIKNTRNILVDMIKNAKSTIYMEQLFMYDKYIVDALIKKKKQLSSIDIKMFVDRNDDFRMNGFPNTIFMKQLIKNKIEIRHRPVKSNPVNFPNGEKGYYYQKNNRKITSIDGLVLLGGSADLRPASLQGSTRELGAQIFDKVIISKFNKQFLNDWNSIANTEDCTIENFQIKLKNLKQTTEISASINDLAATLVRSKDQIEHKY